MAFGMSCVKDQDVRQPARLHRMDLAAVHRILAAGVAALHLECRLLVRRAFLGDAQLHQRAVGIAEPDAVELEALGRIEPVDPQLLQPLAEPRHVVLEGAERDVVDLLPRAFGDGAPAVRVAVGVERELAALLLGVQPEQAVEFFGLGHVTDQQIEVIERVHAELAGAALSGLGHGADLGHGRISFVAPKICIWPGRRKSR